MEEESAGWGGAGGVGSEPPSPGLSQLPLGPQTLPAPPTLRVPISLVTPCSTTMPGGRGQSSDCVFSPLPIDCAFCEDGFVCQSHRCIWALLVRCVHLNTRMRVSCVYAQVLLVYMSTFTYVSLLFLYVCTLLHVFTVCMCVCVCIYICLYMCYWAPLEAQMVKKSAYNAEDLHPGSLDQEDPLEEGMATHSSILA